MKKFRLWRLLNTKKKSKVKYGAVYCPECGVVAFTNEDTPRYMKEGYCFRCGKHMKWEWRKIG